MICWLPIYETGNEQVDADHKELFRLLEEVLSSLEINDSDKSKIAIDFMLDYTNGHFMREEKMMEESEFPGIEGHKEEHRTFYETFRGLCEKFTNHACTLNNATGEKDSRYISSEITKTIVKWLIKHVTGSDRVFATYYNK